MVTFKSAWLIQGSKLTLANSQNASDFDNLRARKMPTLFEFASGPTSLLVEKISQAKLCKWINKLTSSPVSINEERLICNV